MGTIGTQLGTQHSSTRNTQLTQRMMSGCIVDLTHSKHTPQNPTDHFKPTSQHTHTHTHPTDTQHTSLLTHSSNSRLVVCLTGRKAITAITRTPSRSGWLSACLFTVYLFPQPDSLCFYVQRLCFLTRRTKEIKQANSQGGR